MSRVVYHTTDPIEHLRLRIRIRFIDQSIIEEINQSNKVTTEKALKLALKKHSTTNQSINQTEHVTKLAWQQRVPSLDEIQALTQRSISKAINQSINQSINNQSKHSYQRAAEYVTSQYPGIPLIDAAQSMIQSMNPVYVFAACNDGKYINQSINEASAIINPRGLIDQSINQSVYQPDYEVYTVLACDSRAPSGTSQSIVLANIRLIDSLIDSSIDCCFDMIPGFSNPSTDQSINDWYIVKIGDVYWQYRIENDTELMYQNQSVNQPIDKINVDQLHHQEDMINQSINQPVKINDWYLLPPPGYILHDYFVTINQSLSFAASSLYITWRLTLPLGWLHFNGEEQSINHVINQSNNQSINHCDNPSLLEQGCTHISEGVIRPRGLYRVNQSVNHSDGESFDDADPNEYSPIKVHHFSVPLTFSLLCPIKSLNQSFNHSIHQLIAPTLSFQVNSIGMFDVHRVEGYGSVKLPLTGGSINQSIKCFKALGSFMDRLTIAFLGGGLLMDLAINQSIDQSGANLVATESVGTGSIDLTIDMVTTQSDEQQSDHQSSNPVIDLSSEMIKQFDDYSIKLAPINESINESKEHTLKRRIPISRTSSGN